MSTALVAYSVMTALLACLFFRDLAVNPETSWRFMPALAMMIGFLVWAATST